MDSVSNPVRREVSNEVSVLVRKLGKYLGGIDVEKVMSSWVRRMRRSMRSTLCVS